MAEPEQITCGDGFHLAARRFRVPTGTTPRAAALCVHAMMTSSRYLDRPPGQGFASFLAAAGIETWTLDLRGHGDSRHPDWRRIRFDDWVRLDLPAALAHVRERASGPVGYVGHSLGGLTGTAAFGRLPADEQPKRMVLVATHTLHLAEQPLHWRGVMAVWELVARTLGYLPTKRLGIGNEDVPGAYAKQFADWARHDRWCAADGEDYRASAARLRSPVLVVAGGSDRLCRPRDAERFAAHLGSRPARPTLVVPWADHFTLFTDARARGAWAEVADFLALG